MIVIFLFTWANAKQLPYSLENCFTQVDFRPMCRIHLKVSIIDLQIYTYLWYKCICIAFSINMGCSINLTFQTSFPHFFLSPFILLEQKYPQTESGFTSKYGCLIVIGWGRQGWDAVTGGHDHGHGRFDICCGPMSLLRWCFLHVFSYRIRNHLFL